ncbi:sugar ABC transporter substrate-binding protein [Streptosporangiaceae bacterium NEAU-GS5]|nr:sugar ABC transporter substrate-binding protein [Streptosporangiaceae bacterium NEAU-GS5]
MRMSSLGRRRATVPAAASALCVLLAATAACGGGTTSKTPAAAAGGAGAAASPACPNPTAPLATADKPNTTLSGTLNFWGWTNDAPNAIVPEFNKAYPNVKVNVVDVGAEDIGTKLLTAMRAGQGAPDISEWQDDDAPSVWNMPLTDLTACMKPHVADFPDFKIKNVTRPDGTIQAVPWEAGPMQLAYRRDTFKKYGIDPSSLKTWDDFIAAGKKLAADSGGQAHLMMSNQVAPPNGIESLSHDFRALVQQNGGQFFDAKGDPTFTDPKNVEALNLIKRLRDEGVTVNDVASDQAAVKALASGSVATWMAPAWWKYYPSTFAKETSGEWGGIPLPAFHDGGARSSNRGGTSLIVTQQSKNPEAAFAFLSFWLLTVEGREVSYEKGGNQFEALYGPVSNDPVITAPDPFFGGDKWTANAAALAKEVPQINVTTKSTKIDDEFEQLLPGFLQGKMDAATLLSELENAVMAR